MRNRIVGSVLFPIMDVMSAAWLAVSAPALVFASRARAGAPFARWVMDRQKVSLVPHHYYEPVITARDLKYSLSNRRNLNGFNMNDDNQLKLIRHFSYGHELMNFPLNPIDRGFYYKNNFFEFGDSEILYSIVRSFKPKNIIEIGCGFSSLMIEAAIAENKIENSSYACRHICIEPFEAPFLDGLGIEIIRKKVEDCDRDIFSILSKNDILFIDSSHVIRPQGDVLYEYSQLMGMMNPGVMIHVHDIFTPRDYPDDWVLGKRLMWNEQYLLEAFLAYNSEFEVMAAVNWLKHEHFDVLAAACPVLRQFPLSEPGSFWFRRRG